MIIVLVNDVLLKRLNNKPVLDALHNFEAIGRATIFKSVILKMTKNLEKTDLFKHTLMRNSDEAV